MPNIEIGEDQAEYLEGLRTELEDEFGGTYSTVTDRDVLQYLIDEVQAHGSRDTDSAAPTSGAESDRLDAMMNLLTEHADRWEETNAEQGKYAVTLPDGSVEHARTKDDVKAVLFRHY